jgi:hypothetical protein
MARLPALKLTKQWVDSAVQPSIWDVGNEWLYKLCECYPAHTDTGQVAAKIWLIGRAYAAAAERGVSGKGQGESYIIQLSERFIEQKADKHFEKLPKPVADFRKHLDQVIDVHHSVESIFSNEDELGRISLTSKYLHFHRPDLFPIFDSRAAATITQVTPDSRFTGHKVTSEHASTLYGKFSVRSAWLVDQMGDLVGHTPTLRQLDNLLLQLHRNGIRKPKKGQE